MPRNWRETPHGLLATRASALSDQGKHADALELLAQAIELRPEDPLVLTYQGRILGALGRYDEAEQVLRQAIGIDPKLPFAWNELGMLMESREEFDKAAFCYRQSADLSPCVEIWTMLANMLLAFDPQESLEIAERALSIDPDWDEAQDIRDAALREIRGLSDGNS